MLKCGTVANADQTLRATLALAEEIVRRVPAQRLKIINIAHTLDPSSPISEDPDRFGVSEISLRTFSDYLRYGERCATAQPWTFDEGERGFSMPGRDLPAMAQRWDALAARYPEQIYGVPRH